MPQPLLELKNVTVQFGGLKAVSDLSFTIGEGELLGLIGPNGAGKTTVFNLITGVYRPTSGSDSPSPANPWSATAHITARGMLHLSRTSASSIR